MKKILTGFVMLFAFGSVVTFAQTAANTDSIEKASQLEEVVVVGQNQSAKAGELSFIPTKRQKEAAMNGYDLLRHLAMPQITVGDFADNISTISGEQVAIFINGLPASDIEVKALKTKNVL